MRVPRSPPPRPRRNRGEQQRSDGSGRCADPTLSCRKGLPRPLQAQGNESRAKRKKSVKDLGALVTAATSVSEVPVRRWSYLKLDCGGPCVPKRCAKTKSILKKRIEGCAGRAVTQQQLGRGCCCRPVVVVVVVVVAVAVVVVADVASSLAPYPKTQRYY